MDRRYLSPLELLSTSTQHAYCADYLLRHVALGELQRGAIAPNTAPNQPGS